MTKTKLKFKHKNGQVEGIYLDAGENSPLVIIVNGHNGFYNYGMFPFIQQKLWEHKISSYSFNYSHGGVTGDNDFFDDLDKYEQNCMRLEVDDVMIILQNLKTSTFKKHLKVFLLAHSLGGVPAAFGTTKAAHENIQIDGLILVSTVSTLNFWPSEMIKEWNNATVFYKKNNRTKQDLPQGFEFLQEILKSGSTWNVEENIKKVSCPILIIHGEADEAVPYFHAENLFSWIRTNNKNSKLASIKHASHTFNTKHPFEQTTPQLKELLGITIAWVKENI